MVSNEQLMTVSQVNMYIRISCKGILYCVL